MTKRELGDFSALAVIKVALETTEDSGLFEELIAYLNTNEELHSDDRTEGFETVAKRLAKEWMEKR